MKKHILSAFLALAILLTLLPTSAFAAVPGDAPELVTIGDGALEYVSGRIRENAGFIYPTYEDIAYSNLPSRLDTRGGGGSNLHTAVQGAKDYQTPVKDQGRNGLCWAFSTYAAMEANAKKNGLGNLDFSELHMGYATSGWKVGSTEDNPIPNGNAQGWERTPSGGGNRSFAAAYLMRNSDGLSGAVMESADPYITDELEDRSLSETMSMEKSYQAQNIIFLTGNEKATSAETSMIKQAVMTYGGVGASMYCDQTTAEDNPRLEVYFNEEHAAYYLDNHPTYTWNDKNYTDTNHDIEIAGWDDDFPAANFNAAHRPKNNGAWLVKNSWGDDWGDGGYFWISYEDTNFPLYAYYVDGVEKVNPSETVYETDYKAGGAAVGYTNVSTLYCAKAFTANNTNEQLTSVRVMINQPCEIAIDCVPAATLTGGSYAFAAKKTERVEYPGWYTVDLGSSAISLDKIGTEFAVVIKIVVTSGTAWACYDSYTTISDGAYMGYDRSDKVALSKAERNFCIKAITTPGKTGPDGSCDGGDDCPSRKYLDLGGIDVWYHEAVDYVLRNNLMDGIPMNMLFLPNQNLTRAELAQMLYNLKGRPSTFSGNAFYDVVRGSWYEQAVIWAEESGIVYGYGNGYFKPNNEITRQELATMLWRFAGRHKPVSTTLDFVDSSLVQDWAREPMLWATENHIVNGMGGGVLNPTGNATRAQIAQMLKNLSEIQ